jgi:hypothetical protein
MMAASIIAKAMPAKLTPLGATPRIAEELRKTRPRASARDGSARAPVRPWWRDRPQRKSP